MKKVAILLSTHTDPNGNNLNNIMKIMQVCKTVFAKVDIVTLYGESPQFGEGEKSPLQDLSFVDYTKLDYLQHDYQGLIVPDGIGHYHHHVQEARQGKEDPSISLREFIYSFVKFKKPICMIASGCGALLATVPNLDEEWMFKHYSMTAPSNMDAVQEDKYGLFPSMEEFIYSNFGQYTFSSRPDGPHLVVDDHLITVQRTSTTLLAIQTFILLCNR